LSSAKSGTKRARSESMPRSVRKASNCACTDSSSVSNCREEA